MATKILKFNNETLAGLCVLCKCCLADSTHCAVCHTTRSIDYLCGCGGCPAMAEDYMEREKARIKKLNIDRKARAIKVD